MSTFKSYRTRLQHIQRAGKFVAVYMKLIKISKSKLHIIISKFPRNFVANIKNDSNPYHSSEKKIFNHHPLELINRYLMDFL